MKKIIIYSSFNRDLQRDAFKLIKTFGIDQKHITLMKPRDEVCHKKEELATITARGFSPAEILCRKCSHKITCEYYEQKHNAD